MLRVVRPQSRKPRPGSVQFLSLPGNFRLSDSGAAIASGDDGFSFGSSGTATASGSSVARIGAGPDAGIVYALGVDHLTISGLADSGAAIASGTDVAGVTGVDSGAAIASGVDHLTLSSLSDSGAAIASGTSQIGDISIPDSGVAFASGVDSFDLATLRQTWAISADSAAASLHTYTATSQADYAGDTLLATDAGVYLIGGTSDAGAEIRARVRSGLSDFGTHLQKRLDSVDAIVEADGAIIVKVRAVLGGQVFEYWYQSPNTTASVSRERVVNIGRGLRSIDWGIEISNRNNEELEVDDVIVYPIPQSRRR